MSPERLAHWLAGFTQRHGVPVPTPDPAGVRLDAPDGASAILSDPWRPGPVDSPDELLASTMASRRFGLLLVRRAAHAIGVVEGTTLVRHRVDTHYVQGRTKAGGWSQQRYARRRGNQAAAAYSSAADDAAEILVDAGLDAIVCGGDRRAVEQVMMDPRLASLGSLRLDRLLNVPDPRLYVLADAVEAARAITVRLNEQA